MSTMPPPPVQPPPPAPGPPGPMGPMGGPTPLKKIKGPALSLIIVSGISILLQVFSLLASLLGFSAGMGDFSQLQELEGMEDMAWIESLAGGASIGIGLLTICLLVVILFGSMKMMKLENYGLSLTAAILACVPCFTTACCIGIPFGIWALVVMNQPDVKAAFT